MSKEIEDPSPEFKKSNRQKKQERQPNRQSTDPPILLRDHTLSRKIRKKKENLVSKKARK